MIVSGVVSAYLCAFLAGLLLLLIRWKGSRSKILLIEGPKGLPLIGNLHQLAVRNPYEKLSAWAYQYGKIYRIRLGTKDAVVINETKLLKEIFSHPASTGKLKLDLILRATNGNHGLVSTEGQQWAEQRTFSLKSLKSFGFGNVSLEPIMLHEVTELISHFKNKIRMSANDSICIQLQHTLRLAVINTLWTIVSGERIKLDDNHVAEIMHSVFDGFITCAKKGMILFPWLKYVPPGASSYKKFEEACDRAQAYIDASFTTHEESFDCSDPKDLIGSYIEHIKSVKDPGSSFYGHTGRQNVQSSLLELFIAGSETTSATLNFFMFYLSQHPEMQVKLHQEIDQVIGDYRDPTYSDKYSMPFMEAVILETLRYSALAPIGTIHELMEDIQYDGLRLPKGLILIPNLHHIHHNKHVWGDPENFRPERFLQPGNKLKERLVPFQDGKRRCIGENLAMEILFMFGLKIVQTFDILPDPNVSREDYMQPDVTYALLPKSVDVILKVRNKV